MEAFVILGAALFLIWISTPPNTAGLAEMEKDHWLPPCWECGGDHATVDHTPQLKKLDHG